MAVINFVDFSLQRHRDYLNIGIGNNVDLTSRLFSLTGSEAPNTIIVKDSPLWIFLDSYYIYNMQFGDRRYWLELTTVDRNGRYSR